MKTMERTTRTLALVTLAGTLSACAAQKAGEANLARDDAPTATSDGTEVEQTDAVDMAKKKLASSQSPYASWPAKDHFITRWKVSDNHDGLLVIPAASRTGFDYDVDWDNDGVFDELGVTWSAHHYYGGEAEVTVAIRGTFPHMMFIPSEACELHMEAEEAVWPFPDDLIASDKLNCNPSSLEAVEQWGAIEWRSTYAMFRWVNLQSLPQDAPDLSNVEDMSFMFEDATYSGSALDAWDVSNVKKMDGIFARTKGMTAKPSWWVASDAKGLDDETP